MRTEVTLSQMRQPVVQSIPSGMIDDDVEIFSTGDRVFASMKINSCEDALGCVIEFSSWPTWLKKLLKQDLSKEQVALQALIDLGLETDDEMLWQYARCRFGSFDGRPDLKEGKFLHTEYWDCGLRGQCPYEGKLCCSMKMYDNVISSREMQVWRLVTIGKLDKEIAAALHISDTTVPQHVRNLCRKCKVRHRGELIRLGSRLNIA